MEQNDDTKDIMIRYLLGLLPEVQQERFEASCSADGDLFEEAQVVEEEMIDDYVNDQLSPLYREHFEQHYLCSEEHRQRVMFAMALKLYSKKTGADRKSNTTQRWWQRVVSLLGMRVLSI